MVLDGWSLGWLGGWGGWTDGLGGVEVVVVGVVVSVVVVVTPNAQKTRPWQSSKKDGHACPENKNPPPTPQ